MDGAESLLETPADHGLGVGPPERSGSLAA